MKFSGKFSTKTAKISGFSLTELMVVIIIISALAALSANRLMSMVARGRQAEAKSNLSQIHTLQESYQLHADNYAEWAMANNIGYKGDSNRNCNIIAGAAGTNNHGKTGTKDGAFLLGWKPKGCSEMRYGYWVIVETPSGGGTERFFAVAYAASDTEARIYPTCDGKGTAATIDHELKTTYTTLTATNSTAILGGVAAGGDLLGISEEKTWQHGDIIDRCQ